METGDKPFPILALIAALLTAWLIAVDVRIAAAALVDFLENPLTDCRVGCEEAPFDHPSLVVPNGPSVPATGGGHTCH